MLPGSVGVSSVLDVLSSTFRCPREQGPQGMGLLCDSDCLNPHGAASLDRTLNLWQETQQWKATGRVATFSSFWFLWYFTCCVCFPNSVVKAGCLAINRSHTLPSARAPERIHGADSESPKRRLCTDLQFNQHGYFWANLGLYSPGAYQSESNCLTKYTSSRHISGMIFTWK